MIVAPAFENLRITSPVVIDIARLFGRQSGERQL